MFLIAHEAGNKCNLPGDKEVFATEQISRQPKTLRDPCIMRHQACSLCKLKQGAV